MLPKTKAWTVTALIGSSLAAFWYYRGIRVGQFVSFHPAALAPPIDVAAVLQELPPDAQIIIYVDGVDGELVRGPIYALNYRGQYEKGKMISLVAYKSKVTVVPRPSL
jgi:hypothetical protein